MSVGEYRKEKNRHVHGVGGWKCRCCMSKRDRVCGRRWSRRKARIGVVG